MAEPTNQTQPVPNPPGTPDVSVELANQQQQTQQTGGTQPGILDVSDPSVPVDSIPDPFEFDTSIPDIGGVPDFGGEVDHQAAEEGLLGGQGTTSGEHTYMDENGNIRIAGGAVTREVQDEEKTSHQLSQLLRSDSKYMQDARRQGLEQSAAMGGLGGTVAAGASMQAAIRAGLPIAQADADAFQKAAAQNMDALNQYAQLNLQRATQLQTAHMDAKVRMRQTAIQNNTSIAMAKLDSATKRDISRLDANTQLRAEEMRGQIQSRMAAFQHRYNTLLEDQRSYNELMKTKMQGDYGLADTELQKQWEDSMRDKENALRREATANQLYATAYDGYMNRLAELNNVDMDNTARTAAIANITKGSNAMINAIRALYPDLNLPELTPQ